MNLVDIRMTAPAVVDVQQPEDVDGFEVDDKGHSETLINRPSTIAGPRPPPVVAPTRSIRGPRYVASTGHFEGNKPAAERQPHGDGGRGGENDGAAEGFRATRDKTISSEAWVPRVASDNSNSHVAQLERELENELAQSATDTVQIPEPRHVKYATVMAKKLRRDSHRVGKAATRGESNTKVRMTPEERRELTRVQREVVWNLQRDYVVTVVGPEDEPVPYKRQGNPAVNTPQCVRRRQALRKKPLIQEISNEYWCFPGLNPEGSNEMTKESYVKLNRKLHLALIPDTTEEEARRSAEVDWSRDTARWGGRMTRGAFASSMFELADIWTENIDEEEYTAFLWLLLETITNTNVVPPSFKPDQEIECIIDKDLSDSTTRIRSALADAGTRGRMSLPLDMDAIAAILAADRGALGNLSPQLKDKHVQRLRALRQRLQALKHLRTWSAPGAGGGGAGGGGVGSADGDATAVAGDGPQRPEDEDLETPTQRLARNPGADIMRDVDMNDEEMSAEALIAGSRDYAVPQRDVMGRETFRAERDSADHRGGNKIVGGLPNVDRGVAGPIGEEVQIEEHKKKRTNQDDVDHKPSGVLGHPNHQEIVMPSSSDSLGRELVAKSDTRERGRQDGSGRVSLRVDGKEAWDSDGAYRPNRMTLRGGPYANSDSGAELGGWSNNFLDCDGNQERGAPAATSNLANPVARERGKDFDQTRRSRKNGKHVGDGGGSNYLETDRYERKANGHESDRDSQDKVGVANEQVGHGSAYNRAAAGNIHVGAQGHVNGQSQGKIGSDGQEAVGNAGNGNVTDPSRLNNGNTGSGGKNKVHGKRQGGDDVAAGNAPTRHTADEDHDFNLDRARDRVYGEATDETAVATTLTREGVAADDCLVGHNIVEEENCADSDISGDVWATKKVPAGQNQPGGRGGGTAAVTLGDNISSAKVTAEHGATKDTTDRAPLGSVIDARQGKPRIGNQVVAGEGGANEQKSVGDYRGGRDKFGGENSHEITHGGQMPPEDTSNKRVGSGGYLHRRDSARDEFHGERKKHDQVYDASKLVASAVCRDLVDGNHGFSKIGGPVNAGNGDNNPRVAAGKCREGRRNDTVDSSVKNNVCGKEPAENSSDLRGAALDNGINSVTVGVDGDADKKTAPRASRRTSVPDLLPDVLVVKPSNPEEDESSAVGSVSGGDWKLGLAVAGGKSEKEAVEKEEEAAATHHSSGWLERAVVAKGGAGGLSASGSSSSLHREDIGRESMKSNRKGGKNDQTSGASRGARDTPFHVPAGGQGGWDGISGTTDEQWEQMIQQAKNDKKEKNYKSAARQAEPAKKHLSGVEGRKHSKASLRAAPQHTPVLPLADASGPFLNDNASRVSAIGQPRAWQDINPNENNAWQREVADQPGGVPPSRSGFNRNMRLHSVEAGGQNVGVSSDGKHKTSGKQNDNRESVERRELSSSDDGQLVVPKSVGQHPTTMLQAAEPANVEKKMELNNSQASNTRRKTQENVGIVRESLQWDTAAKRSNGRGKRATATNDGNGGNLANGRNEPQDDTSEKVESSSTILREREMNGTKGGRLVVTESRPSEDALGRLQGVLKNHNMSLVDVFAEGPTSGKPQDAFWLATQDWPADNQQLDRNDPSSYSQAPGSDLAAAEPSLSLLDAPKATSCSHADRGNQILTTANDLPSITNGNVPAPAHPATYAAVAARPPSRKGLDGLFAGDLGGRDCHQSALTSEALFDVCSLGDRSVGVSRDGNSGINSGLPVSERHAVHHSEVAPEIRQVTSIGIDGGSVAPRNTDNGASQVNLALEREVGIGYGGVRSALIVAGNDSSTHRSIAQTSGGHDKPRGQDHDAKGEGEHTLCNNQQQLMVAYNGGQAEGVTEGIERIQQSAANGTRAPNDDGASPSSGHQLDVGSLPQEKEGDSRSKAITHFTIGDHGEVFLVAGTDHQFGRLRVGASSQLNEYGSDDVFRALDKNNNGRLLQATTSSKAKETGSECSKPDNDLQGVKADAATGGGNLCAKEGVTSIDGESTPRPRHMPPRQAASSVFVGSTRPGGRGDARLRNVEPTDGSDDNRKNNTVATGVGSRDAENNIRPLLDRLDDNITDGAQSTIEADQGDNLSPKSVLGAPFVLDGTKASVAATSSAFDRSKNNNRDSCNESSLTTVGQENKGTSLWAQVPNYLTSSEFSAASQALDGEGDQRENGDDKETSTSTAQHLRSSIVNIGVASDDAAAPSDGEERQGGHPHHRRSIRGERNEREVFSVTGTKMLGDTDIGWGQQHGSVGSYAPGRKSVSSNNKEGSGLLLRRSSSSAVWRYDDPNHNHQAVAQPTSLSVTRPNRVAHEIGQTEKFPDGRSTTVAGLRPGEVKRKNPPQRRPSNNVGGPRKATSGPSRAELQVSQTIYSSDVNTDSVHVFSTIEHKIPTTNIMSGGSAEYVGVRMEEAGNEITTTLARESATHNGHGDGIASRKSVEETSGRTAREELAVAVARKIADVDGTQFGEALAEVRHALMSTIGVDPEAQTTTVKEAKQTPGTPTEKVVYRSSTEQTRGDRDAGKPSQETGKAPARIQRPQSERDNTELNLSLPCSPNAKQTSTSTAREDIALPVARARQDHLIANGSSIISNASEYKATKQPHHAARGTTHHGASVDRIGPPSDRKRRRSLPKEGGPEQKATNFGEAMHLEHIARSCVSPTESYTGVHGRGFGKGRGTARQGNDNPRDTRELSSGENRVWDQQPPAASGHRANRTYLSTTMDAGKKEERGKERKWLGDSRETVPRITQPSNVDGSRVKNETGRGTMLSSMSCEGVASTAQTATFRGRDARENGTKESRVTREVVARKAQSATVDDCRQIEAGPKENKGLGVPREANANTARAPAVDGFEVRIRRGRGNTGSGEPMEAVATTARPVTVDDSLQNSQQGWRGNESTRRREVAPVTDNEGDSHSGLIRGNGSDHFARERPGDRYYLPPPTRKLRRPRTTSVDSGNSQPDQKGREQREPNKPGRERARSVSSINYNRLNGSFVQSPREGTTNLPSGRVVCEHPGDYRQMLGLSDTPKWRYSWRTPSTTTSTAFAEEEPLPYYVDRKQVWQYVPDIGLPPWRTPAPGEPGWEPILNYCKVRNDEEEEIEERKRRDYLCRRRNRTRGGHSSSICGGSSYLAGGSSLSAPSRSVGVHPRVDDTEIEAAPEATGLCRQEKEEEEHEDSETSPAKMAIARRVNAQRSAATAGETKPAKNNSDNSPGMYAFSSSVPQCNPLALPPPKPADHASPGYSGGTAIAEDIADDDLLRKRIALPAAATDRLSSNSVVTSSHLIRRRPSVSRATPTGVQRPLQPGITTTAGLPSTKQGGGVSSSVTRHQRRRFSLGTADKSDATTMEMIRRDGERRRNSLPLQASPTLLDGQKSRQQSDYLPQHYSAAAAVAASAACTLAPSSRPRTSVGGSRWSQNVLRHQHAKGRSRLAPATRTAGGRWGANHGQLETLFPGEELAPPPSRRENSRWVLDVDPNL